MNFLRVVVFLLGFLIVVRTLISAVRTFVGRALRATGWQRC
jgi:hypothetical protein